MLSCYVALPGQQPPRYAIGARELGSSDPALQAAMARGFDAVAFWAGLAPDVKSVFDAARRTGVPAEVQATALQRLYAIMHAGSH